MSRTIFEADIYGAGAVSAYYSALPVALAKAFDTIAHELVQEELSVVF